MPKNSIPFVDLRGKTPVDLLRTYPDKARDLVLSARKTYGLASRIGSVVALPFTDKKSRAWLERTQNPYHREIESMAEILESRGVYTLNVCFEWGCTSGVWRTQDTVSLLRVLDWPFPGLGQHAMVLLQQGKAGEFYNISWPGVSGMFTGMAPNRFAAALNQAPMRMHGRGFAGDWATNRLIAGKQDGLPASHLLRQVFETATNYVAAKQLLAQTPIAVPAIYVLSGLKPGEGCVIERLEDSAEIIELSADHVLRATNHFNSRLAAEGKGWRPREIDSHGRYKQSGAIDANEIAREHFGWLQVPVINAHTRLCVIANAAANRLMAQGYEGSLPVTELFNQQGLSHEEQQAI